MLDKEGTLTISGTGAMTDYTDGRSAPWRDMTYDITNIVIEDGVTRIGNLAFLWFLSPFTIELPDTLTEIGDDAFYYAKGLHSINIPDSVTSIEGGAFAYSGLDSIVIPDGVTTLEGTFCECMGLESVKLPASLTKIGLYTFFNCYMLPRIEIPAGVTEIGGSAFLACEALSEIVFTGDAPTMADSCFDDVTATVYYPANNATWTDEVKQNYGGTITWTSYEVEEATPTSGTCGENLTWVLDSEGILTISGTGAMEDYSEETPAPWDTYWELESIRGIVIEAGVTRIGDYAMDAPVWLPENIFFKGDAVEIGSYNFGGIQAVAFYPAGNATWTGDALFIGPWITCKPYSAEGIVDSGTCGENLTWKLDVDCILTISGTGTMDDYSEETLAPWSGHMEAIHGVVIEEGVSSIGSYAFYDCYNPNQGIIFKGDAPKFVSDSFEGATATVYCPLGNPTWTADVMQDYGGNITWIQVDGSTCAGKCGENLTWLLDDTGTLRISGTGAMDDYIFYYGICAPWDTYSERISSVVIESGVTRIGDSAFASCTALEEIIFEGDAPTLGGSCFYDVTATAYYPANNATWTDEVKQNYGGNITWKPIYDILDGADTVWTPEEEKPVAVRADAAIEEFLHVMLNGELVDPQHYDVTEGSTIITFHEDFLATLEPGKYSVTMYFESGIANTSLTISTPAYKLGDVNGDGKLNAKDATAILKKIVGKLENPIENFDLIADVNEDGKVNAKDATKILKTIVGKDSIEGWEK